MSDVEAVRQRFAELRAKCEPEAHDLLDSMEELAIDAVELSVTIQAHIAVLEHERRVREAIGHLMAPTLRSVS